MHDGCNRATCAFAVGTTKTIVASAKIAATTIIEAACRIGEILFNMTQC